jgi:hypothetical protein
VSAVCLLIGVDGGSREAVLPLAAYPSFSAPAIEEARAGSAGYWDQTYEVLGAAGIAIGTSDSSAGRAIETQARLAAARRRMKIVAIEDYPGNYFDVPGAPTDLVVAESACSEAIYRERYGDACPPLAIFCSARYDHYRVRARELRRAASARWSEPGPPKILWAGQPESEDCIESLRRIAPAIAATGATLLLKAHPRDPLHPGGDYARLLGALALTHADVTHLSAAESLELAPQLVLTQFSSVAIEAGFFGIPALHLLYHEVGGARLRQKKGFGVPPYCRTGAGWYLQESGTELDALRRALFDPAARASVIGCFDDFFATRDVVAPRLAQHLAHVMGLD